MCFTPCPCFFLCALYFYKKIFCLSFFCVGKNIDIFFIKKIYVCMHDFILYNETQAIKADDLILTTFDFGLQNLITSTNSLFLCICSIMFFVGCAKFLITYCFLTNKLFYSLIYYFSNLLKIWTKLVLVN